LDRRFEKVFRSFFVERNGELSMVKKITSSSPRDGRARPATRRTVSTRGR
jgi:hypothetical protein